MEEYEETEERRAIVEDLDQAQKALERAAEKLRAQGKGERAHRVLNAAQSASAQRELLALDWHDEDKAKAA